MTAPPKDRPAWLLLAVPVILLGVVALVLWARGLAGGAEGDAGWWNLGTQAILAGLLFWYVLETRRVANETQGLRRESAAQLNLLREQHRVSLAPFPVPTLLPQIRYDDPEKTPADYARERGRAIARDLQQRMIEGDPIPKHVEALTLTRRVLVRLEGPNLAQDVTLLLRLGLSRVAMKSRAVVLLTSDQREATVEIEPVWSPDAQMKGDLEALYGGAVTEAAISHLSKAGDHYVAMIFRDVTGGAYLLIRQFAPDDDVVANVEHGYCERIAL